MSSPKLKAEIKYRNLDRLETARLFRMPSFIKGVSPVKSGTELSAEVSIWSKGDSTINVTYQGGPVINNPQTYNVFVGDWSSEASQTRMQRMDMFMTDLINSRWMSIFTQYGCENPGKFNGSVVVNSSIQQITDRHIQSILQQAISNKQLPEASPEHVFMIFLSDNMGVKEPELGIDMCNPTRDNAFGYHHYFKTEAGQPCYYCIIPSLTDLCVNNTCFGSVNCSLKLTQTREERQTQVASHEFAEVITDPESNAWYDVGSGYEVGDICNGWTTPISVNNNIWSVQPIYSKRDDEMTNGVINCVAFSTGEKLDAPKSSILAGLVPEVDFKNHYNRLGGGIGLTAALVLFGLSKNKSFAGLVIYCIFGFVAGMVITGNIKKYISVEQKDEIKKDITKIENVIY